MMSKNNSSNKKTIIAVAVLLVLVIGAIVAWYVLRPAAPPAPEGQITVTVEVTHGDKSVKEFTIVTTAENLRGALEQENLIQGDEGQYGLFVKTVDGETVNGDNQEWWCFTNSGEVMMTGVDDTLIADGDHYEIVFTVGW